MGYVEMALGIIRDVHSRLVCQVHSKKCFKSNQYLFINCANDTFLKYTMLTESDLVQSAPWKGI